MPASLLHSGHAVGPGTWNAEVSVIGIAMVIAGLYIFAVSLEEEPVPWRRISLFGLGFLTIFLALVSPLDAGADRLLSLHMLQHVALTTIGPPLVLLGLPVAGLSKLLRWQALERAFNVLTLPLVTAALFIVNMWLWHLPPVYEAALDHLALHIAMHVAFIGTGLAFWWTVINPLPERARTGDGGRLLYLFVTGFPMGVLALLLIASPSVVYSYYANPPHLWGVSPLEDQQIAGIIMGVLGESASFVAMTLLFFKFMDKEAAAPPVAPGRGSIDAA